MEFTYNADAASSSSSGEQNIYVSIPNANAALRRAAIAAKDKRADDFSDFPIYKSNSGKRVVSNSEELWIALEHNYLPVFATNYTNAEKIFEDAKTILRQIIGDGMSDYEKTLAIFDYLVESVEYDYAALASPTASDPIRNACYFLEGVFDRSLAVCDGKSKAFVLLCRIEGIECLRDFGTAMSGGVGHAWNYVKLGGEWYLVDTTNADAAHAITSEFGEFFEKDIEITVYETFLADVSYHSARYKYSGIHSKILPSESTDATASFLNAAPSGRGYDFHIESTGELNRLLTDLFSLGLDECMLLITVPSDLNIRNVIGNVSFALGVSYDYDAYEGTMCSTKICYLLLKKK